MIDLPQNNSTNLIAGFLVEVERAQNISTRRSLLQTVDALRRFLGGEPLTASDLNEELLGEWVSWLFYRGYSPKTIGYYLTRLSSLCGKTAPTSACAEAFRNIKARLAAAPAPSLEINATADCFNKLRRLVVKDPDSNPARRLGRDLLLFAIYSGGLTFSQLARYRKDDYQGSDPAILEIIGRYATPRNKYLFPLRQSERTPRQLDAAISTLFAATLRSAGITLTNCASTTAADLWAVAAMRCHVPAADIAACLADTLPDGATAANPLYAFAPTRQLTPAQRDDLRRRVALTLSRNPEEWYAMQFRPGVNLKDLLTRIQDAGLTLRHTFYPMEEITSRIGKKLRRHTRPVVAGLLFFQSRATELPALFYNIGDLAWGYRTSRNLRSPYATIPPADIDQYQKAIGKFIDGIDAYPDGEISFQPGDKVQITGGDLEGRPAIFQKEIRQLTSGDQPLQRITYRLRLLGTNNITWTVDTDPRMLTKITDHTYRQLLQA